MITDLGWINLTCSKCRAPLTPLTEPDVYAVRHMPGCPRRCWTVCELAEQPDGVLLRRFRQPATTAEPRHMGCRWCDARVDRLVRAAARRGDGEAVRGLSAWGHPVGTCRCPDCVARRGTR